MLFFVGATAPECRLHSGAFILKIRVGAAILLQVDEISKGNLSYLIGGAGKIIFFRVTENIAQAVMISTFQHEVTNWGAKLKSGSKTQTVVESVIYLFAMLRRICVVVRKIAILFIANQIRYFGSEIYNVTNFFISKIEVGQKW